MSNEGRARSERVVRVVAGRERHYAQVRPRTTSVGGFAGRSVSAVSTYRSTRLRGSIQETERIMSDIRNVVLVHGGFVDGSGWQGVYDLLTADGFTVRVVQNATL